MKTKEINVWIDNQTAERLQNGYAEQGSMYFANMDVSRTVPAKLIIQIPEKKIEITESEFRKAIADCKSEVGPGYEVSPKFLFEKLFGINND